MSGKPIGRLRHRLILEQSVPTPDGGGGVTLTWVQVAQIWGALEPLSGRERVEAGRIAGRHMYDITIRHRGDVKLSMRFALGTRIFHILSAEDVDGRGRWLKTLCEEREL